MGSHLLVGGNYGPAAGVAKGMTIAGVFGDCEVEADIYLFQGLLVRSWFWDYCDSLMIFQQRIMRTGH